LRPAGGNATNQIKAAGAGQGAQQADLVLVPQANGTFNRYHYDSSANGGTGGWKSGLRDVADPSTITVPAGGAFFIRKAADSTFNSYHPPDDE
jgi:hypothetical protein